MCRGQRAGLLLLLLIVLPAAVLAGSWKPATFPDPKKDLAECGRNGVPSNICDPDFVLGAQAKDYIEGVIMAIWNAEPPYKAGDCAGKQAGYQVAVAVMRKMEFEPGAGSTQAAQDFAKALHDKWGVGDSACNNGVLFLLSIDDRQVYISTGKGARDALLDARVTAIIADIQFLLHAEDYDGAVKRAVVDIGLGLAGGTPKGGDGGAGVDWFTAGILGVLATVFGRAVIKSVRRKREYRDCKRMLVKLKQEQENLRSHAWSCPQSCPICLEDFTTQPPWRNNGGSGDASKPGDDEASTSAAAGSSGLDAEAGALLGGGSASSDEEFSRMSAAGRATVRRLRQRRRGGAADSSSAAGSSSSGWAEGAGPSTSPASGTAGQDGRRGRIPVTLGCGHTFCEPCIETWLDKGTTCPVCRKPISEGSATESGDEHAPSVVARQRLADDWLATDLAFRLAVLQHRYPTYITPAMVDTWSGEAQATGSFSWENSREFQLTDPSTQQHYQQSGGGGFSSSFGGGSSFKGGGGGGSCPEREEVVSAPASSAGLQVVEVQAPPTQAHMLRSKSEVRILRLEAGEKCPPVGFASMPSLLLQASRRRLEEVEKEAAAATAQRQAAVDSQQIVAFVDSYMEAIKDGNESWASQPAVGELFLEDARMIAADKQSFHGRPAIVRRLNQGVAQLTKMAGEQAMLPTFQVEGPMPDPSSSGLLVKLAFKRGLQRMTFTLQFTMQQGKVAVLRNTRS